MSTFNFSLFSPHCSTQAEIIIYSTRITERLKYACDFIFKRVGSKNYMLTDNQELFLSSDKIKINYDIVPRGGCINLFSHNILFENNLHTNYTNTSFLCNKESFFTYDIFSEVFFHLSRYEEWVNNKTDPHGRFEHTSAANTNHLIPQVDLHVNEFYNYVKKFYPNFVIEKKFQSILTFDLDNILAFKGKGFFRTAGALVKHLSKTEYSLIIKRVQALIGTTSDPFEFVYQDIQKQFSDLPIIFFILCRSNTPFDRAADITKKPTQHTIRHLSGFANIGLHPSYYSSEHPELISKEKILLENITGQSILASRQHYLRMDIKTTPKHLLRNNIYYDFTMGFASHTGFRAGTSYPFYYYDFDSETTTSLLFIPFCIMDGAYFNYQKKSTEEAAQEILTIKKNIQDIGGYFIPLFHEITLSSLFFNNWKILLNII